MTKIAMRFVTTTDIPIGDALVAIRLTRSDYEEKTSGVIMTRLEEFHTDADGFLQVDLLPAKALYHVTVYDTVQDIAIHHDFIVPVVEDQNTVLMLPDLIVPPDTVLSSLPYDEEALATIIQSKVEAIAARNAAREAALQSQASADTAVGAKINAEAAWTDFDKRYFGAFAVNPTINAHGAAPVVGSLYWNTVTKTLFVWTGAAWYEITLAYRTTQNRKIVVFGSSVAYGYGSPSWNGWATRLSVAMAARGYTMVNKSVGGNKTSDLINRFYTDVVPENPGIVIIGLSLANEGLMTYNRVVVYNQYIAGMRRLVAMCREMGYKVVVTGVYSNNDYTAADYPYLIQADQELEYSDIPYINFLGAVDDGTGKWRAGMWTDAGHPNDVGHEALFRAFPLSLFDNLSTGRSSNIQVVNPNIMKIDAMVNDQVPVVYTSESPFGSFTLMARIRRTSLGAGGKPLIALESSTNAYQAFRIRNQVDALAVSADATDIITSSVLTSTGKELCLILSFDYFTNMWRFWIDGVLIGSAVYAPVQAINYDQIAFGGRTNFAGFNVNGYEYSDMAVWRSALTAEQVAEATAGRINKASLNMYAPVVDVLVPMNYNLVNLAPSSTCGRVTATGITTYPRNAGTSVPKSNSLVRTQDNGYVDPAMIDPLKGLISNIVEVRGPSNDTNASSYLLPSAANGTVGAAVDVESLRLGIGGQAGVTFPGQWSIYLSAGAGSTYTKEGFKYTMKAKDASSGTLTAALFSVSGRGVVYVPLLKAGSTDASTLRHNISRGTVQAEEILYIGQEGKSPSVAILASDGVGGWSSALSVMYVGKNSTTSRGIASPGTFNAQGTDYAEYYVKCFSCAPVIAGQIVGVDNKNQITDLWADAVMFAIKSTDPSFVGGDNWSSHLGARPPALVGAEPFAPARVADVMGVDTEDPEGDLIVTTPGDTDEEWEAKMADYATAVSEWEQAVEADRLAQVDFDTKLEEARARVDRIAIAGRVPVNVQGAQPGDYIVPVQDGEGIKGIAVKEDDMTLRLYLRAVGQVITIEEDGRAYVMVKSV